MMRFFTNMWLVAAMGAGILLAVTCDTYYDCYTANACNKSCGKGYQSETQRCGSNCNGGFPPCYCTVVNCSAHVMYCEPPQGCSDSYTDRCSGAPAFCPCDLW